MTGTKTREEGEKCNEIGTYISLLQRRCGSRLLWRLAFLLAWLRRRPGFTLHYWALHSKMFWSLLETGICFKRKEFAPLWNFFFSLKSRTLFGSKLFPFRVYPFSGVLESKQELSHKKKVFLREIGLKCTKSTYRITIGMRSRKCLRNFAIYHHFPPMDCQESKSPSDGKRRYQSDGVHTGWFETSPMVEFLTLRLILLLWLHFWLCFSITWIALKRDVDGAVCLFWLIARRKNNYMYRLAKKLHNLPVNTNRAA